jgi:hypothetical protein
MPGQQGIVVAPVASPVRSSQRVDRLALKPHKQTGASTPSVNASRRDSALHVEDPTGLAQQLRVLGIATRLSVVRSGDASGSSAMARWPVLPNALSICYPTDAFDRSGA